MQGMWTVEVRYRKVVKGEIVYCNVEVGNGTTENGKVSST